jgi:hypothetical protein
MRKLGIGFLGLLGGFLLGFIIHDILARVLLDDGMFPDSLPLALLVGFLTPTLAVVGVVVALAIDNRHTRRRGEGAS